MDTNQKNILKWDFIIPSFFKEEKFKINSDLLSNKKTKEYISDQKLEYVFKCILGSFFKKRKKPVGVFNETTLDLFNSFVDMLNNVIDRNLKINLEYKLQKQDLKSFRDYFNLKYEIDVKGDQYFDMYDKFEDGDEKKKGKKKVVKGKEEPIKGMEEEKPFEPKKEIL